MKGPPFLIRNFHHPFRSNQKVDVEGLGEDGLGSAEPDLHCGYCWLENLDHLFQMLVILFGSLIA